MPGFSPRSLEQLNTCHPDLIRLFMEVIKYYDCTIIQGHRPDEEQAELLRTGMTQLGPGKSEHNKKPSRAVDAAPYYSDEPDKIPWDDRERFILFGGFVLGTAARMGINIRWGGDWDSDRKLRDQRFHDLPHFELI